MKLKLVNGSGALQVSEAAFGMKFNEPLVHQVLTAYRNAGRAVRGDDLVHQGLVVLLAEGRFRHL